MMILVLIAFVLIIPLVLIYNIPIYKEHRKVTGSIINYDPLMRKFVYKVEMPKQNIMDSLMLQNDIDELSCTFDFERSVIRFSEYGSHRDYYYQIIEYNGFSILRLNQVEPIGMQSHVPYKLNPFLVNKLQAQIVPFSQYEF